MDAQSFFRLRSQGVNSRWAEEEGLKRKMLEGRVKKKNAIRTDELLSFCGLSQCPGSSDLQRNVRKGGGGSGKISGKRGNHDLVIESGHSHRFCN